MGGGDEQCKLNNMTVVEAPLYFGDSEPDENSNSTHWKPQLHNV